MGAFNRTGKKESIYCPHQSHDCHLYANDIGLISLGPTVKHCAFDIKNHLPALDRCNPKIKKLLPPKILGIIQSNGKVPTEG